MRLHGSSDARVVACTSVHPSGYAGSYDSWPIPPDWLDFHFYQAGHFGAPTYLVENGQRLEDAWGSLRAGDGGYAWIGALKGYHQEVPIPVLNGEVNYEDLFTRFWEISGDTTSAVRITADHVRQSAWWGLLSGGNVGFAYGANGVWQWAYELNGGFYTRRLVLDALSYPGSSQLARMKQLAEDNDWQLWVPRPDLATELDSTGYVPVGLTTDRLVAYLPLQTTRVALSVPESFGDALALAWFSTTSEDVVRDTLTVGGDIVLTAPDARDWLVVVTAAPRATSAAPLPVVPSLEAATLTRVGSNPARTAAVAVRVSVPQDARLDVFDVQGRRVHSEVLTLAADQALVVALPLHASGVYMCRLTVIGPTGEQRTASLRLTVVR